MIVGTIIMVVMIIATIKQFINLKKEIDGMD